MKNENFLLDIAWTAKIGAFELAYSSGRPIPRNWLFFSGLATF
jgi:hypothetical protein